MTANFIKKRGRNLTNNRTGPSMSIRLGLKLVLDQSLLKRIEGNDITKKFNGHYPLFIICPIRVRVNMCP